ncbi:MAG TPA: DUF1707 domain-containing protein [Actinomycetospora sp.]|jgi:hypothetical protein|uniref:DUF1707 domain-containing protein n=1 Tax=Actinomycetospora sp. TaxID=1872135 RepID=UPI002F429DAD
MTDEDRREQAPTPSSAEAETSAAIPGPATTTPPASAAGAETVAPAPSSGPEEPADRTGDLPPTPADLPVDHDDREHIVGLLQAAVSRGLLDTLEFDRRSGLATTARARRELNALVVDLPLEHPDRARARTAAESRQTRTTAAPPPDETRAAYSAGDTSGTVALHARMGSVKRAGAWAVPRRLEIDGWLGSAELDLTEAVIDHEVVEFDVDMTLGSVELRLPDSASASLDAVSVTAGSVEDKRRQGRASGRPHVVVTGKVAFGSVEVKGPKWWKG